MEPINMDFTSLYANVYKKDKKLKLKKLKLKKLKAIIRKMKIKKIFNL